MDALEHLAAELERLSEANLRLSAAMQQLDTGADDSPALWAAASAQRQAARAAAELSAKLGALREQ